MGGGWQAAFAPRYERVGQGVGLTPRRLLAPLLLTAAALFALYVLKALLFSGVPALKPRNWPTCYAPERNYSASGFVTPSGGGGRPSSAVTLISITSGLPAPFVACMRANRLEYARAHGYEFCEFDAPLNRQAEWTSFSRQKMIGIKGLLTDASRRRDAIWRAYNIYIYPYIDHSRAAEMRSGALRASALLLPLNTHTHTHARTYAHAQAHLDADAHVLHMPFKPDETHCILLWCTGHTSRNTLHSPFMHRSLLGCTGISTPTRSYSI